MDRYSPGDFKVGDRVRSIDPEDSLGEIGVVRKISDRKDLPWPIDVEFSEIGHSSLFCADLLELVQDDAINPGPLLVSTVDLGGVGQADAINPAHYKSHPSGIECIQVTEWMTNNCGNVVKYLWRSGLKAETPVLQDLEKAKWYIEREIARVSGANG